MNHTSHISPTQRFADNYSPVILTGPVPRRAGPPGWAMTRAMLRRRLGVQRAASGADPKEETMSVLLRAACSALAAGALAVVTSTAPAGAAALKGDYLVVDTQGTGTSDVVAAGGRFDGCSTVTDLANNVEVVRNKTYFTGDKQVSCASGDLVLHYAVVAANKKTHGTWFVLDSSVPGITEGGGRLDGTVLRCTPDPGSEFCILDTFVGTLG